MCFEVLQHLLISPPVQEPLFSPTIPSFTQLELPSTGSNASIAGFCGSRVARKAEGLEQQEGQNEEIVEPVQSCTAVSPAP